MQTPNIGTIAGTPNTGLENSDLFVRDVDPMLYFFETDKHPIVTRLLTLGQSIDRRENENIPKVTGKAIKKQATKNPKFEHFEDAVNLADKYNPTAAVAATDTSITVSSTDDDHFIAGDMILLTNAAGQTERLVVSSVAANTLNVLNANGDARTAGITMTTSDEFYRQEFARAEDSTAPAIRTTKRAGIYNYIEFFSESYGLTNIKRATSDYNGDPLMLEKRKAISRFLQRMENTFWFGERNIRNESTNPVYQTGGFKYWAETYSDVEIRDMSGYPLTRAELNSFLSAVMRGGSTDKVLVCDSRALSAINNMGYADVEIPTYKIGEMGMNIRKISGPFGKVELVYEPLFDDISPMRGSMAVLDMNNLKYRYMEGNRVNLDMKDKEQLLADGSSAKKGTYEAVCGFHFSTMKHMGWMKNIGA